MTENSKIEWTNHTVNFWWGCTKVGPGCDHCYAEGWANRCGNDVWGVGKPRKKIRSAAPTMEKLNRTKPGDWVFCSSMSDLFDNEVPIEWFAEAWQTISSCNQLKVQIVTKRISNVQKRLAALHLADKPWPRHVGLLITVCNQNEAERDVPRLLELKERLNISWVGLSIEPLLGAVDIGAWSPTCYECGASCGLRLAGPPDKEQCTECGEFCGPDTEPVISEGCPKCGGELEPVCPDCGHYMVFQHPDTPNIDWVICGGESGPHARPMHPDWARSLRDQCQAAGVPFFFKQWGAWAPILDRDIEDSDWRAPYGKYERSDRHCFLNLEGGCGFHGDRLHVMERRGFKNAGHLLDGLEWRQMPGDKDA
nr:DUF5131 family protein [uncultured Cohaesibacter sp.]